jgi:hypothetical protein
MVKGLLDRTLGKAIAPFPLYLSSLSDHTLG